MVNCAVLGCSSYTRREPGGDQKVAQVSFFSMATVIKHHYQKTTELRAWRMVRWFCHIYCWDTDPTATHCKFCGKHFVFGEATLHFARRTYVVQAEPIQWAL